MNKYDDERKESGYGRIIRESKEEAFHARRALRREQPNPSGQVKRQLAAALADYADVLQDYAEERALETDWDDRLPIHPDHLLSQTTVVERPVSARNPHAVETARVPAVFDADATKLLGLAKELDSIAKELGFAADAKQPTPQGEAEMDDLLWLLKARGQDKAIKQLPEGGIGGEERAHGEQETATDGGEEG